jgi:hypothetical protein
MASVRLLRSVIRKVGDLSGRPEEGRWVRAVPMKRGDLPAGPRDGALDRGRLNPDGLFPVLYATEARAGFTREIVRTLKSDGPDDLPLTLVFCEVHLCKVLDLCDPKIRRILGVTVRELADPEPGLVLGAIGETAHQMGFDGVIYPRPLRPERRNLAIFLDRVEAEGT